MKNSPIFPLILLLVLAFVWGSSFILMKEGLKSFSSWQVAAFRIAIAGILFIPVFYTSIKKVDPKDYKILFLSGITGSGIPAFLFTYAQLHINSSTAGALNALTPIFTLIIGVLFLGVTLSVNKTLGVLVGFAGALMLIVFKPEGGVVKAEIHGLLIIIATFLYGINVNLIKHRLSHYNAWTVASLPILFMFPFMFGVLFYSGFFATDFTANTQTLKSLAAISILGIIGTALSLVAFNKLIQITNAVFASSVTYLIPVVALFWGVLDGERTGLFQIAGLVLILIGIAVIRRKT